MSHFIDLSGPLCNGMWSYNSLPTIGVTVPEFLTETVTTVEQHGFESFRFVMGSLSGTYLETGAHNIAGMPALSDLECSAFVHPAVVCHLPRKQARELIHRAELEANCPPINEGDALLIECGWGGQWRSPNFIIDGPSFHPDCLPWLVAQPLSLLGVDVPCIQAWWAAPGSAESGAGMLVSLFKKGILLLAPLVNLETVRSPRGELIALPLNVVGASGAPCRAIWRENDGGGRSFHITGDYTETIPNPSRLIRQRIGEEHFLSSPASMQDDTGLRLDIARYVDDFFVARPGLQSVRSDLLRAYRMLVQSLEMGGTIFLCGNGGSFADALHISGELLKSYERARPLPAHLRQRLAATPGGERLAANLQSGLRAIVLGANAALASAVQNDFAADRLGFAQELLALAHPGDVLVGLSTSGNAENVLQAVVTARALGLPTLVLTGEDGGRLAPLADIAIRAPARGARHVQELHQPLYHLLCGLVELHFFPTLRNPGDVL